MVHVRVACCVLGVVRYLVACHCVCVRRCDMSCGMLHDMLRDMLHGVAWFQLRNIYYPKSGWCISWAIWGVIVN